MSQAAARSATATFARSAAAADRPFFGLIDCVLVEDLDGFEFPGAIARSHAAAAWTWIRRDLAADLVDADAGEGPHSVKAFEAAVPQLLERAQTVMTDAAATQEAGRRLRIQLGGEKELLRLPVVLDALKCRPLLVKAQGFGRAVNGLADESAIGHALQAMPLQNQAVGALLMQATVGQVANPARLITATVRIAGASTEAAIQRAGFSPVVEAILAHAQNQVPVLQVLGPFADIDLTCRAIHRFHRLVRALNTYLELTRGGRWATITAALTKRISERLEARLRDVPLEVNRSLRRARDGADRLDSDQLLSALNGVYVLSTVRECRESLALNALFDRGWTEVGEGLEMHIRRNLEFLRQNPGDKIVSQRLDASIKMAELRFNAEYAEVLRRAKEAAERR